MHGPMNVKFKIYASVSGGLADSFFGVREFQEGVLAKYIFSNVDLCKGIQSVS
jgi:hypothetical protein